jgi:hypothetical protein
VPVVLLVLAPLGVVPLAAVVLDVPVLLAVTALLDAAPPPADDTAPPRLEMSDCKLLNRLPTPLPDPVSPSDRPGGANDGAPPTVPSTPPPEAPLNDINWDSRPLDNIPELAPATALPDAWSADDAAENVVAVVPAAALPNPGWAADCAARNAAICVQRSFCPDIELTMLLLLGVSNGLGMKRASRQDMRLRVNATDHRRVPPE